MSPTTSILAFYVFVDAALSGSEFSRPALLGPELVRLLVGCPHYDANPRTQVAGRIAEGLGSIPALLISCLRRFELFLLAAALAFEFYHLCAGASSATRTASAIVTIVSTASSLMLTLHLSSIS